ncbi:MULTISPECIES: MEDS domain-containing protein [Streptomyces]|uniref:MEDS domain-containing protein n=1 Tax=Streptomyces TaxID=1883 RepID=UPI0007477CEE|nr:MULTISPECIES: MEDS domain-containing protein [Streptomyces]KUL70671.1 antagonist protein [Streptomyces sp. NRRL WC-3604]KUL77267.1 antagonist protein [Streptomyces sp. NRRL WC-3605]
MRATRTVETLDEVDAGDHVCQLLDVTDDVMARSRAFVADGALFGDKVLIVSPSAQVSPDAVALVLDPTRLEEPLLAVVRREAASAESEGYRSLRVLNHVTAEAADLSAERLLRSELELEEFAADSGAAVVCAYQRAHWDDALLEQLRCVHPHHLGTRPLSPSFQLYRAGRSGWTVKGIVDTDGALAFSAILLTLLRQATTVRLLCHTLDFFDAAGMSALADAARALPDRKIVLEGTNETVRLAWELSGFADPSIPVVMTP